MAWIPIAAWALAAVIALIVLGYCAYEISWKAKRLQRDVAELTDINDDLVVLRAKLDETRERLAASGLG